MLYKSLALTSSILISSYNIEILLIPISKACLLTIKNCSGKSLIIYALGSCLLRFFPLLRISLPIGHTISRLLRLHLLLRLQLLLLRNCKSISLHSRRTKTKRCQYGLVKWWHIWYAKLGLCGGHEWIQFRTISTIFDNPLPSSLFDSKPSGFCSCYSTYRGSGTLHFTVLFPITNLSLLRFPFTPSVLIRFPPLLRTISTIPDTPLPPPYSIPSPVISVVAMAVIEVLAHTSIYGSLLRFTVPFSPISDFRTFPYLL